MAEKLRELMNGPGFVELPGCHDTLSAMLLENAGFPAVFLSGFGVAAATMGNPDIGLTSLVETASVTKNVTNALNVPLVVDADNGYGNEDNVIRTVHELEYAGAAAMIMEDQIFPKRCGHVEGKKVIPLELYMKKLECALNGRKTSMCIVARTDALAPHGIDEAIKRATIFSKAGADVTLIDGISSIEGLKRIGSEVPGHKVINLIYGGKTPILPAEELFKLGFKFTLYSTPALFIIMKYMMSGLGELYKSHDLNVITKDSIHFKDFLSFIEKRYGERIKAAEGNGENKVKEAA